MHIHKLKAYISISSYLYSYIHEKTDFFYLWYLGNNTFSKESLFVTISENLPYFF